MDFGSLLHQAQRNERNAKKEPVNYYRTTFDPPKKESKSAKSLSANIQKFLERREQEERRKEIEAKKKRDELLALRSQDGKAKKRVAAMLNRTKAANKSAIADAVDDDNTAVTLGGPAQCDEDDYGYVSQEATAFYAKLMDKYQSAPPEEPLFPQEKKTVVHDLKSTKDRVKMALLREEEEEMMPRKRKRKPKDDADSQSNAAPDTKDNTSQDRFEERRPPPKPKKMAPPPLDFNELLKIAQQKQFEPVSKVEPKVAVEEPERPMTKKQREEYLKEMEYRKRKEERDLARQNALKERARKRGDGRPTETEREDRPNKIPRLSETDDRVISDRLPRVGDGGEVKPAPSNRIPKLSDKYRNDSTQQRIPKLGDSSRQTFNQDRDSTSVDSKGQKVQPSQVRIPKLSSSDCGGQGANLGSQQRMSKPNNLSSSNEERRMKLNLSKDELNRNRVTKDDERRLGRPEDQQRMKMKVSTEKNLYQKSNNNLGDSQVRQATVSRDVADRFVKPKAGDQKPKMNGNNSNMSGNLPKQLNGMKMVKDKTENKPRPTNTLERREVDNIRGKIGEQKKTSNGVKPSNYSKKLQESLQNKFQQGRDDANRKPDNVARNQNSGTAKAPSKYGDGGVKVLQNSQVRDSERRNGMSKPTVNNGSRPAPSGASANGQDRKSLGGQQVVGTKRPVPGSQLSGRPTPGDKPRNLANNDGRPRQFPPDDVKLRKFPPQDVRPRQFPPPDVKKARPFPPPDVRKKPKLPPSKRRIIDSEDEYDSELDDFIDDGPDETEDYSKHIKEIFGYDKSRYANIEDDEDECMESNFGQVLREEFVSTKLGIMEDLEDIQKEQEEKRMKAIMKKKKLK